MRASGCAASLCAASTAPIGDSASRSERAIVAWQRLGKSSPSQHIRVDGRAAGGSSSSMLIHTPIVLLALCILNCPIIADRGEGSIGNHYLLQWRRLQQEASVSELTKAVRIRSPASSVGILQLRGGSSWSSWSTGSSATKKLWNPENDVEVCRNCSAVPSVIYNSRHTG